MFFVPKSLNSKIAGPNIRVAATYAPIKQSCPTSCPLQDNGCYAQNSFVGIINKRNETSCEGMSPLDIAKAEAAEIDAAYNGGRVPRSVLRLHVAGDAKTPEAAETLAAAVTRWFLRGGGVVWSYTHAWREVARHHWGRVSILASVETDEDIVAARAQGYMPAVTVSSFDGPGVIRRAGTKFIPCPAQTNDDKACSDCGLCMKADYLRERGFGIAFAVHGTGSAKAKKRLSVLNNKDV